MPANHLYSFRVAQLPVHRRQEEERQGKQSGSLWCFFQVSPSCHFNTQPSSTSTLLHVFSQKNRRQSSNLAERHQRQVGLRQMPRIRTRGMFCLTGESQIHRPPISAKFLESRSSWLGLREKVFRQKDHKCHGKMDAFHLQSKRQYTVKHFGSQEQQQSVIKRLH